MTKAVSYGLIRKLLLVMSRVGLFPPGIWKRLPVERTFTISLPGGASFQYASIARDQIGRALFWKGWQGWEPETVRAFSDYAKRADTIMDIGANSGLFTLLAATVNPSARIVSFEPVPHIYERFVYNLKINGYENRCQARQEAVSNFTGHAKLQIPLADAPLSSSLLSDGFRGYHDYEIEVPVVTVDSIWPQNFKLDLAKIDAEGIDDKVLEGMQRILVESHPTIFIECLHDGPYEAIEGILSRFGYRFFHLRQEGLVPTNRIIPDATGTYRNYLCACTQEYN